MNYSSLYTSCFVSAINCSRDTSLMLHYACRQNLHHIGGNSTYSLHSFSLPLIRSHTSTHTICVVIRVIRVSLSVCVHEIPVWLAVVGIVLVLLFHLQVTYMQQVGRVAPMPHCTLICACIYIATHAYMYVISCSMREAQGGLSL